MIKLWNPLHSAFLEPDELKPPCQSPLNHAYQFLCKVRVFKKTKMIVRTEKKQWERDKTNS